MIHRFKPFVLDCMVEGDRNVANTVYNTAIKIL
jgi:hypothetical protein